MVLLVLCPVQRRSCACFPAKHTDKIPALGETGGLRDLLHRQTGLLQKPAGSGHSRFPQKRVEAFLSRLPQNPCDVPRGEMQLFRRARQSSVRTAGAQVIALKGATFYAIALSVRRICECILRDTDSVMTVSAMIHNQYGINDVCLSLPFVVGAQGIRRAVVPPLTKDEEDLLHKSADALKQVISQLEI